MFLMLFYFDHENLFHSSTSFESYFIIFQIYLQKKFVIIYIFIDYLALL